MNEFGAVPRGGDCDSCDLNCDALHDVLDVAPFVTALIDSAAGCSVCAGDLDGNESVDGRDVQPFIECLLSPTPTSACCLDSGQCVLEAEPACSGVWLGHGTMCVPGSCAFAGVTAYRPQHGTGYFPFTRTAVSEAHEDNVATGPGVRINAPGDDDPLGEDDLVEVVVETSQPAIALALRRTNPALRVWTTRTTLAGSEIPFTNDRTDTLPTNGNSLTIWVEWAAAEQGDVELHLEPLAADYSLDVLRFHTFRSIVMALGGEDQAPAVPVDPNQGTFVLAIDLYRQGYDVHMHDEDHVAADGLGTAYAEVVDAVSHRMVDEVSIFGYSHGGGSTHDLADRLDQDRAGIGVFEIVVTSYVDAVENDSDFDLSRELRRPPSSGYHANHYQVGSFADVFLDGGPVPDSDPQPTGRNVETTAWGAGATHFQVDDFPQVRDFVEMNLTTRLMP
ncbi:MAG TPA: hypothetical protein VNT79_03790 [Phycisphaerae bacterium]|nr:hypothetical protein [Phycisphaerae bacterium]